MPVRSGHRKELCSEHPLPPPPRPCRVASARNTAPCRGAISRHRQTELRHQICPYRKKEETRSSHAQKQVSGQKEDGASGGRRQHLNLSSTPSPSVQGCQQRHPLTPVGQRSPSPLKITMERRICVRSLLFLAVALLGAAEAKVRHSRHQPQSSHSRKSLLPPHKL